MEASGVIQLSNSEWAFPTVMVKKEDGSLRFCVDYRRLKSVVTTDVYPMPRVDELIDRLGNAKFITTLDLTRGYWQVPMEEGSRPMTAFTTPFGLYQFQMMPFGLSGAPAVIKTWKEHLEHLRQVLWKLDEAGLTAKPRKCQFAMKQCSYLGHVVEMVLSNQNFLC